MQYIELDSCDSTNLYVKNNYKNLSHLTMVTTREQRAGRGQKGNHWESEPGKNLTFSIFLCSGSIHVRSQFSISEAIALGICESLSTFGIGAKVKWPNDIYVGNRKVCGILIEHSVMGMEIMYSVVGAGVNVNQQTFLSDAPNPVSMIQLKGTEFDLKDVRNRISDCIERKLELISDVDGRTQIHEEFLGNLYRGDGKFYLFEETGRCKIFEAKIAGVEPIGCLLLEDHEGMRHRYAFKEVRFVEIL